jgi:hypothetical protein
MSCGGCGQARAQFFGAVRRGDLGGVVQAVGTAININMDKIRGVDVEKKYGGVSKSPIVPAVPYRRQPGRTV